MPAVRPLNNGCPMFFFGKTPFHFLKNGKVHSGKPDGAEFSPGKYLAVFRKHGTFITAGWKKRPLPHAHPSDSWQSRHKAVGL